MLFASFTRPLPFLLLLATPLACLKSSSSHVATVPQKLALSGSLVDGANAPVEGALVLAARDERVFAKSDASGHFSVEMDQGVLQDLQSHKEPSEQSFSLYFRQTDKKLFSVGPSLSFLAIGAQDLGTFVLRPGSSYDGKVMQATGGQLTGPAGGAEVWIGPNKVKAGDDGSFHADDVPVGTVPLVVKQSGLTTYVGTADIKGQPPETREDPIVLFGGGDLDGLVIEKANRSLGELVQAGHPTAKHFHVMAAQGVRFIRYYHDGKRLENLPADGSPDIPWHDASQDFDYDFPQAAGQILYYQFADGGKTKLSQVLQVSVNVDLFADMTGVVIGDGSGHASSSRVTVKVGFGKAVTSMRLATSAAGLASAPWQVAERETIYDFKPDLTAGPVEEPVHRELFVQLRDVFNRESQVYHATVELVLFDGAGIQVAGAGGLVTTRIVPVAVQFPPGVEQLRMAASATDMATALWEPARPQVDFTIPAHFDILTSTYEVGGATTLCLQMKEVNGFLSRAFCQTFVADMFPLPEGGFVINGGAPVATSRLVDIDISLPANAYEMRIFEIGVDPSLVPISLVPLSIPRAQNAERLWLAAAPHATYTFTTAGSRTLYVQFRSRDGMVSPARSQSLVILPMEEAYAKTDFVVNGGASLTLSPVLSVDIINVPATAIAMLVAVGTADTGAPSLVTGPWQMVRQHIDLPIQGRGDKTVYVAFRNSDLEVTAVLTKVIRYDPFPPGLVSFVVDKGAATTFDRLVQIEMQAPPTAYSLRFSCDGTDLQTVAYQEYQQAFPCQLPAALGYHEVRIQLRTIGGEESPEYLRAIELVDPFPKTQLAVTLNEGATTTTDPTLRVAITAPSAAASMWIYDSSQTNPVENWQPFAAQTTYKLPATPGSYTVTVKVRTESGVVSAPFGATITLN